MKTHLKIIDKIAKKHNSDIFEVFAVFLANLMSGNDDFEKVALKIFDLKKLDKKEINIQVLKEEDLINQNTSKVKVIKDTESCPKLNLKGINTTTSVKGLIESAGGKIEV